MNSTCPIWGTPAEDVPIGRDGREIISSRAGGKFFVSGTAEALLKNTPVKDKIALTNWIIDQHRFGVKCPDVMAETVKEQSAARPLSANDRADRLLRFLENKSDLLGHVEKFFVRDYPDTRNTVYELLAWTASQEITEVVTLQEYCAEEGWTWHRKTRHGGSSGNTLYEIKLKPTGYSRLTELDGANPSSIQAFVAMWFDDSLTEAYERGIAPGIEDAGYEPLRLDRKDYNNKIDDEIIAEIRRSRFIVADFTQGEDGARGGVYYEAGFAYGLNIPVIFTCREDAIDEVHFDTRQYNHIAWKTPEELRARLTQRISATIGDGPMKKV